MLKVSPIQTRPFPNPEAFRILANIPAKIQQKIGVIYSGDAAPWMMASKYFAESDASTIPSIMHTQATTQNASIAASPIAEHPSSPATMSRNGIRLVYFPPLKERTSLFIFFLLNT